MAVSPGMGSADATKADDELCIYFLALSADNHLAGGDCRIPS
jgi:hypothetical protein